MLALRQLRVLAVRSQSLQRLTAGVAGLVLLRRLDLSANADLAVDADVPLNALRELRSLDLSDCRRLATAAPLAAAAGLPRLRLLALHGCTAGSLAAENALAELSLALRRGRPDVRLVLAKADEVRVTGLEDDAQLAALAGLDPARVRVAEPGPHVEALARLSLGRPPRFPGSRRGHAG